MNIHLRCHVHFFVFMQLSYYTDFCKHFLWYNMLSLTFSVSDNNLSILYRFLYSELYYKVMKSLGFIM